MANDALVYTSLRSITDLTIPPLPFDPLLEGVLNDGVRFLFDLSNYTCWTPGNATQGKVVTDLAKITTGVIVNTSGDTLPNTGNGIDFTGSTGRDCISTPDGFLADFWANQKFLICAYYKLPATFIISGSGLKNCLFTNQSGDGDYYGDPAKPEMVLAAFEMSAPVGRLKFTRPRDTVQNNADAVVINVATPVNHGGLLTQIAVYRNATGMYVRAKSSAGVTSGSSTNPLLTSDNTNNFSARGQHFGMSGAYGVASLPELRSGLKLYRGFAENLARSGRDPIAVLDADYNRVIGSEVFS